MHTPQFDGGDPQRGQNRPLGGERQHAQPRDAHARIAKHEGLDVPPGARDEVLRGGARGHRLLCEHVELGSQVGEGEAELRVGGGPVAQREVRARVAGKREGGG